MTLASTLFTNCIVAGLAIRYSRRPPAGATIIYCTGAVYFYVRKHPDRSYLPRHHIFNKSTRADLHTLVTELVLLGFLTNRKQFS